MDCYFNILLLQRISSESPTTSSEGNSLFRSSESSSEWETDTEAIKEMGSMENPESSSDEDAEKCSICLLTFKDQQVGTPESCDHTFCLECIREWAKTVNTCPVDRKIFSKIHIRERLNGKYRQLLVLPPPEAAVAVEYEIPDNLTFCEICSSPEMEDTMLLCDGCDLGYHIGCLQPPLDSVPEGLWYCPSCSLLNVGARSYDSMPLEETEDGWMSPR